MSWYKQVMKSQNNTFHFINSITQGTGSGELDYRIKGMQFQIGLTYGQDKAIKYEGCLNKIKSTNLKFMYLDQLPYLKIYYSKIIQQELLKITEDSLRTFFETEGDFITYCQDIFYNQIIEKHFQFLSDINSPLNQMILKEILEEEDLMKLQPQNSIVQMNKK